MAGSPKGTEEKLAKLINAWETLRPAKGFGGMTLAEFKTAVQPSFAKRTAITQLQATLTALLDQRDDADGDSAGAMQLVVNGVKADPAEGEDGELYEAMGYVRKSERKSGLTKKKPVTPPPPA